MTGYRQSSNFDPNAFEQPGPPLIPYDKVQWAGLALGVVGVFYVLVMLAGRLGWIDLRLEPFPGFILCIVGSVLLNSRRAPAVQVGSEQLARNRKVLLITVAGLAALGGALLVIQFSGVI